MLSWITKCKKQIVKTAITVGLSVFARNNIDTVAATSFDVLFNVYPISTSAFISLKIILHAMISHVESIVSPSI